MKKPDCNRCENRSCVCAKTLANGIRIPLKSSETCGNHVPIKAGWMLAELALAHPQSLHDALSALPFRVNLDFYLR